MLYRIGVSFFFNLCRRGFLLSVELLFLRVTIPLPTIAPFPGAHSLPARGLALGLRKMSDFSGYPLAPIAVRLRNVL
jgi:hypothetical protein